jgi:hypothetical protein
MTFMKNRPVGAEFFQVDGRTDKANIKCTVLQKPLSYMTIPQPTLHTHTHTHTHTWEAYFLLLNQINAYNT